jgi:hypothetical protein
MGRQNRRWMPVADASRYVGLAAVTDLAAVRREDWPSREVRGIDRYGVLTGAASRGVEPLSGEDQGR